MSDAIVLLEKAQQYRLEWNQKYNPVEPVLDKLEDCVDLFVQSQQIRFPSDLFEQPDEHFYPDDRESANRCGSVAVEVDRDKLADAVEAIPEQQALENAIALAHAEDIDAWVEAVRSTLVERMPLPELIEQSGLSIVQVWIALLFGEFQLEREGDFYEGKILVTLDKTRD